MKTDSSISRPVILDGSIAALLVWVVFLPSMLATYGIYDAVRMAHDYGWLGESRFTGVMQGGGRFLYAWIAEAGFRQVAYIEELAFLRAVGAAGLGLAAAWMATRLRGHGMRSLWVPSFILIALVNPGSSTFVFWSACFPYPFAILLAMVAGELWEREELRYRVVSVCLLQASFAIYQPAALFFPVIPLLGWYLRAAIVRPYRPVWTSLGMGFGMVLHLVLTRIVVDLLPTAIDQGERLAYKGFPETIAHLGMVLVPRVLTHWGGLFSPSCAWIPFLIGLSGIILFLARPRGMAELPARFLTLLPVLGAFVPAIVSADNYTPYRLLAPAYCLVWTVALLGWHGVVTRTSRLARTLPLTFSLLAGIAGFYVIQMGVAQPRQQEISALYKVLERYPGQPRGLIFIRPEGTFPISRFVAQQAEYGAYELSFDGFSESFLSLLAARTYNWPRDRVPLNEVHWLFYPSGTKAVPPFYDSVDLRIELQGLHAEAAAESAGSEVVHPYLGESRLYVPNLYQTDLYGIIQQEANDWFFHPGEGWMQWESEPGELPIRVRDVRGRVRTWPIPSAE